MAEINQPITATPTAVQASNVIELTHIRDNNGMPFFKDGDYFFYLTAGLWSREVILDGPEAGLVKEISPHSISIQDDANGTMLAQCKAYLSTKGSMRHELSKK
tara:strand:+ start:294 stop:602 length:309 start_codon:yes stop_codon:yes gene_type:complete